MFSECDLTPYRGYNPVYLGSAYTGLNPAQVLDTISITARDRHWQCHAEIAAHLPSIVIRRRPS